MRGTLPPPQYAFMAWCLVEVRGQFYFIYLIKELWNWIRHWTAVTEVVMFELGSHSKVFATLSVYQNHETESWHHPLCQPFRLFAVYCSFHIDISVICFNRIIFTDGSRRPLTICNPAHLSLSFHLSWTGKRFSDVDLSLTRAAFGVHLLQYVANNQCQVNYEQG
jgi:hypothetical protein